MVKRKVQGKRGRSGKDPANQSNSGDHDHAPAVGLPPHPSSVGGSKNSQHLNQDSFTYPTFKGDPHVENELDLRSNSRNLLSIFSDSDNRKTIKDDDDSMQIENPDPFQETKHSLKEDNESMDDEVLVCFPKGLNCVKYVSEKESSKSRKIASKTQKKTKAKEYKEQDIYGNSNKKLSGTFKELEAKFSNKESDRKPLKKTKPQTKKCTKQSNTKRHKKIKPKKYKKKRGYGKNNEIALEIFKTLKAKKCMKINSYDNLKRKLMKIFNIFLLLLIENRDNLNNLHGFFDELPNNESKVDEILTEYHNLPKSFDLEKHKKFKRREKEFNNRYLYRLFSPDPIKKIFYLSFQIQYKNNDKNKEIFELLVCNHPECSAFVQKLLKAFPNFPDKQIK